MELLVIAWATSRPITNLPLMVLDQDKSPASRHLIIALENTGTFNLKEQAYEKTAIEDAIDRGQINAALIIPPGYASELNSATGQPRLSVQKQGGNRL